MSQPAKRKGKVTVAADLLGTETRGAREEEALLSS